MKKSLAIKAVIIVTFTFVGFQILILPAYLERQEKDLLESKQALGKLLKLCQAIKFPVFLMELKLLTETADGEDLGTILQDRSHVTMGAMKYDRLEHLQRYRLHFDMLGFKFYTTKSYYQPAKMPVTSHLFMCKPNLSVHVVVFYNRTVDGFWHGNVDWPNYLDQECQLDKDRFFKHPGLIDSFTLEQRDGFMVPGSPQKLLDSVSQSEFIECNMTRTDEFFKKYPLENAEESMKFQRNARQIIARAKQYLDDLGVPFWLSSGTCLGWYRQCSIIPHSQDVDFGIYIKDFKPEIITAFEKGGFFLKNSFGKVSDSYELSFQAGDIKIDLFFFYEEPDHTWNGGTHHETGQKYKYIFPKFSMCWTVFLELKVRVPCPPEAYIEANYGKNWMEPVKEWEWNKSPPNVRENGVWPKEDWKEVIQVF